MGPATGATESVDCSVLTPVRDEEQHIAATLAAMRAQRFDGRLEFVFADGGSSDRTRELIAAAAREDPRIVLVDNPGRTVTSGLNVALGRATGRWVARMDAHTVYPADYLALGVARLRRGDTRWVSGPQIPVGSGRISHAVSLALGGSLGRSGSRKWGTDAAPASEFLLDSGVFCGVWERATLSEYQGWDERWVVNEDSELAGRFLERGERLVCLPAMAARYSPRDTLPGLWRQYSRYGLYRVRTAVAHPDTLRRQHLVAPALVADLALAAIAPAPIRRPARTAAALYGVLVSVPAVRVLRLGAPPVDAMLVPITLVTMHLAWGTGTWRGVLRFGVPRRAIVSALRR